MEERLKNAALPHVRPKPYHIKLDPDNWVWARATEKATGNELIGKLILDIDSPRFGGMRVGAVRGVGEVTMIFEAKEIETPTPLTPKELFRYKLAGKI